MSVIVNLTGRLGNNLFQYALGRIIAEHLDLELSCRRYHAKPKPLGGDPPNAAGSTLEDVSSFFPNAPLRIPGRRVHEPVEVFEGVKKVGGWRGHKIDLNGVLQNRTLRQIRLRGWFQRLEYYAPHKPRIFQWFQLLRRPVCPYRITAADVLVNIRRGTDYGMLGWALPMSYYSQILSSLPGLGQLYVCGDSFDANARNRFQKYSPIYYEGSPIEHFSFFSHFRRVVLSNSTFAWWAAFLSEAEEIFAPRVTDPAMYGFAGYSDVDLHMRESRYKEVAIDGCAPFGRLWVNKTLKVHFVNSGKSLLIDDSVPRVLPANDSVLNLVRWLLDQDGPLMMYQVLRRSGGMDICRVVANLVEHRLLLFEPGYFDDAGSGSGQRQSAVSRQ